MYENFEHHKTHIFKFITNIITSPHSILYQTLSYFKIITMGTNFIYIVEHHETHERFKVLTKVMKKFKT